MKTARQYRIPLFCVVTLLFWASLYTYVPVLTVYLESLGASHKLAGIIVGSYGFVQMLLRIPVGIISDRLHRRKLFISIGLSFSLFSVLGLILFRDLTLILVFRGLAGVAAATWVDFTILFTSYYRKEDATRAIGTISFYNTLGQTVGMFCGSFLADRLGWQASFILGAVVAVAGLVMSLGLVENYDTGAVPIRLQEVATVASDRTLLAVSFIAILSQVVTFATVFGFTPLYASDTLHFSKFALGLLTVLSSLPNAFASLLTGRLLRRMTEKQLILTGFLLTGLFTLSIPFTHSVPLLIVSQMFAGFGRGLSFPMLMGLSILHMPVNRRATAMGFFQAIYGLGMFAGPVILGILGDAFSLQSGFLVMGAVAVVTALLSFRLIPDRASLSA